ncbi:5-deoxy-glucuronate isomerase [Vibrio sp. SCSIO 43140]|uniref:5-deoxy-glucuronate isomerase n=1 Tax=Vibrio sp. SCSIO 43140 TaxID=2819100 RepID=UPI002074BEFF|nr:5-deoxy-glucuronate isomerase [Vibrio sp. SCSIO 43140]USD62869.1 5-deoxy-glucuronate isomerase [Vibrio sp. SCSIO 43140]
MSHLLSKYSQSQSDSRVQSITPESANWGYVGFSVHEIASGESLVLESSATEKCLVLVSGKATVTAGNQVFSHIGERMSPFEKDTDQQRIKPHSVYVAPQQRIQVVAETDLELAVCEAPSKGNLETRYITPQEVDAEHRGKGHNQRYVHNILPDDKPADSLLVVEVFTNEGCTSSYPSHKHDQDIDGKETYLEETYYHRLNPSQGFCMQRVYTDDRELDECMAVYDKDVVMVPKGYHPVATIAGYDSYYLNVMAGPKRKWQFSWECDHAWINSEDYK